MPKIIYLTNEGLNKLQDELKNLKEVKRIEIAQKLKEAISFGDLSENAEYEEARSEQAQVEVRISDIEEQLKNVEIIKEGGDRVAGKVNMGVTVSLKNLDDSEEFTYKIVGATESDILGEVPKISNESPVGMAIMGKKAGDVVTVSAPAGKTKFKIISVK